MIQAGDDVRSDGVLCTCQMVVEIRIDGGWART
jgi:hypothetical protein